MAFGIRVRRVAALAVGQAAEHAAGLSSANPPAKTPPLDPWLDTLESLARKRVGQRHSWDTEARLRLALRRERE